MDDDPLAELKDEVEADRRRRNELAAYVRTHAENK
jgi:hypothetical protein